MRLVTSYEHSAGGADAAGEGAGTGGTEDLLRKLAASDERSLRKVLEPSHRSAPALDRDIHALVQLSALLAAGAVTTSLRWAVDAASVVGVDDITVVQVLIAIAPLAGTIETAVSAPRLALALDVDLDAPGSSGGSEAR
jgi:hypothetical protein